MIATATKESVNDARNDKGSYSNATSDAKKAANDMQQDMTQVANKAGRTVREYLDSANDHITDAAGKVGKEIHENPLRSALIALSVGYVIGALLRR